MINSHSELIDHWGGTVKVSVFFGVSPAAVSGWRKTGIPTRFHIKADRRAREESLDLTPEIWTEPYPIAPAEPARGAAE